MNDDTPTVIQDITADYGIGIAVIDDSIADSGLELIHLAGSNDNCEFYTQQGDVLGNCSDDGNLWGAADFGSPYFCTNHHFPQEQLGYEFIELQSGDLYNM